MFDPRQDCHVKRVRRQCDRRTVPSSEHPRFDNEGLLPRGPSSQNERLHVAKQQLRCVPRPEFDTAGPAKVDSDSYITGSVMREVHPVRLDLGNQMVSSVVDLDLAVCAVQLDPCPTRSTEEDGRPRCEIPELCAAIPVD